MVSSEKLQNLHLKGLKCIIFLIPILPLYISYSMPFPYVTGRNFAFRIIVEIAAALWLPLAVISKRYRPEKSLITSAVLVFVFIVGLADIFGVNPYNSFWSNYERMEGYITILHLLLYFIILKSVLKTRGDWKVFFGVLLLVSVFAGVFSSALLFDVSSVSFRKHAMEFGSRLYGTIGNPPFLAAYLLLSVFVGLIISLNTQKRNYKIFCFLVIAMNSIVIYLTGSRGAILAGISGIMLSLVFKIKEKGLKRVALPLIISMLIMLASVFLVSQYSDFLKNDITISRFFNMFSDSSVTSRFSAWEMALNGIKERPFLGWGEDNFISVYSLNPIPYVQEQIWMDRAHNIIVHWLINAGILGLLSYIAIFCAAFYVIWTAIKKQRMGRAEGKVVITALIVYFIQNLFIFDTINTYLIFFALLAYIDMVGSEESNMDQGRKEWVEFKDKNMVFASLTMASLMILFAGFYFFNYKPLKQIRQIGSMRSTESENFTLSSLLDDYRNVLHFNAFGNPYMNRKMISISRQLLINKHVEQEGAKEFIQETVNELNKDIVFNMHNLEYLTGVIRLFQDISLYESSFIGRTEDLIRECIEINPDYQWLYIALADVYKLKKDYEGVFNNVKKVVEFDPQNDKKLISLALAAIYSSKEDALEDTLEKIRDIRMAYGELTREPFFSVPELFKFVQVYKEMGNNKKQIEYLKKIIKVLSYTDAYYFRRDYQFREPVRKAGIHLELAKQYLILNDKENAVKEAEKAQKLAPMVYKDQISRIID